MHLDDMAVEISGEFLVKAMAILFWVGLHSDAVYVKKGFVCVLKYCIEVRPSTME
jgi:hypothetical protein